MRKAIYSLTFLFLLLAMAPVAQGQPSGELVIALPNDPHRDLYRQRLRRHRHQRHAPAL